MTEVITDFRSEAIDQEYSLGLLDTATVLLQNPAQRKVLEAFVSGEIHATYGGSIERSYWEDEVWQSYVFWHAHGTFVSGDGSVYQVRTDDVGRPQVYVAAMDERCASLPCVQPYTYDVYRGPHGNEMRFDFVNGPHRAAPPNTLAEAGELRRAGKDPVAPGHCEGLLAPRARDSIALIKHDNGRIDGYLTDGTTGERRRLYAPTEVLATIGEIEQKDYVPLSVEEEVRIAALTVSRELGARAYNIIA